jgi:hypothetical protein
MSKFDVDQGIRDLEEAGKPPDWVAEHLRRYRESGGAEGHLFDATIAGVPGRVPCLLLTTIGAPARSARRPCFMARRVMPMSSSGPRAGPIRTRVGI